MYSAHMLYTTWPSLVLGLNRLKYLTKAIKKHSVQGISKHLHLLTQAAACKCCVARFGKDCVTRVTQIHSFQHFACNVLKVQDSESCVLWEGKLSGHNKQNKQHFMETAFDVVHFR